MPGDSCCSEGHVAVWYGLKRYGSIGIWSILFGDRLGSAVVVSCNPLVLVKVGSVVVVKRAWKLIVSPMDDVYLYVGFHIFGGDCVVILVIVMWYDSRLCRSTHF